MLTKGIYEELGKDLNEEPSDRQYYMLMVGLIEIREAIEAQTAVSLADQVEQLKVVTGRLAALESAVASMLHHQHETAQLVQTIEGRIDRIGLPDLGLNVPAAGSTTEPQQDAPTAG